MLLSPWKMQGRKRNKDYARRMYDEGNYNEFVRTTLQDRMPWEPKPRLMIGKPTTRTTPGFLGKQPSGISNQPRGISKV